MIKLSKKQISMSLLVLAFIVSLTTSSHASNKGDIKTFEWTQKAADQGEAEVKNT